LMVQVLMFPLQILLMQFVASTWGNLCYKEAVFWGFNRMLLTLCKGQQILWRDPFDIVKLETEDCRQDAILWKR
jgi:hypothetical protein